MFDGQVVKLAKFDERYVSGYIIYTLSRSTPRAPHNIT